MYETYATVKMMIWESTNNANPSNNFEIQKGEHCLSHVTKKERGRDTERARENKNKSAFAIYKQHMEWWIVNTYSATAHAGTMHEYFIMLEWIAVNPLIHFNVRLL